MQDKEKPQTTKINIHGGFKSIIDKVTLSITGPFIIITLIFVFMPGSTSTQIIASIIFVVVLGVIDFLIIRYLKPRSDSINGKMYYYIEKKGEGTFVLTDDDGSEEIFHNVVCIIYHKTRFIDFIDVIEYSMPKNIKIDYVVDDKEVEKPIGNITKNELKKLKGKGIIRIQKKNKLAEY